MKRPSRRVNTLNAVFDRIGDFDMYAIWMNLDEVFAWVARTSLYAVAVIAVVILAQLLTRRLLSAKLSYALWVVLLLRLVIPTGLESGLSLWNLAQQNWAQQLFSKSQDQSAEQLPVLVITDATTASVLPTVEIEKEAFSFRITPRTLLPVIWLAGALFLIIGIIIGNLRLWNTVRRLPFVTDQALLELFEESRRSMRVQTVVGLVVTNRVKSPILFGFIRPRILLPADLVCELPFERLRYIMLHEFAHLKRCDILTGWVMAFIQSLHWFNPLVWWAFGRIRFDRELACDEEVLSRVPEVELRHYGDVLIGMLERFNHIHRLPAIAGILENKDQLKRRLTMIKKFRRPARREIIAFAVLLTVLSIGLLTEPRSLLSQSGEQSAVLPEESNPSLDRQTAIKVWPNEALESNPSQETQTPIRIGGAVASALLIHRVPPIYPESAKSARVSGEVILDVTINEVGTVDNISVLSGPAELRTAAMEAVRQWRYSPTTLNGTPVPVIFEVRVAFALDTTLQPEEPLKTEIVQKLAQGRLDVGDFYLERGNLIGAMNQYLKTEIVQKLAQGYLDVGDFYLERGNLIGAMNQYQYIVENYPDFAEIHNVVKRLAYLKTDGDRQTPVPLSRPTPDYTEEARNARMEGTVILEATISADGTVDNVEVLRGLGYGLDESAIDTVMNKWTFRPATRNGVPIDSTIIIEISFRLL